MRNLTDRLNAIVRRAGGSYTIEDAEGETHITLYTDDTCHCLIVGEYGNEGLNTQLTMIEQHLTSEGL